MPDKKILILNGGHSEIQLIVAAKQLGFHVITTGNQPNLIGHSYADEYHNVDFRDCDAVLNLAQSLKIDAVCSCANDFGAITAAYVAENLHLGGHDSYKVALQLHQKDKFKQLAREIDIKTPHSDAYSDLRKALAAQEQYSFPVIVKPVDMSGGKGISKVSKPEEYASAVRRAAKISKVGRFVVEPFIEGSYHSFSTILVDGVVRAHFSDNEFSCHNPFLVTTSAGPATGIESVEAPLISEANKIARYLHLVDGVFHIQYIMRNFTPYIIEITRRCSGDWYPEPVRKALGVDWAKWIVKSESGMDCSDLPFGLRQSGFYGRHCIMSNRNGVVRDVDISEEISGNIYRKFTWWQPGDKICDCRVDKLGIVFLEYSSREEMDSKAPRLHELVKVITK